MDIFDEAPAHAEVTLIASKNAIGAGLEGGQFEFGVFAQDGIELVHASNSPSGLITFPELQFNHADVYHYTLRETSAPQGWDTDTYEYPVTITVTVGGPTGLVADVDYPDGVPGFKNTRDHEPCSLIEFPEVCFDKPGEYEFTIKELTGSGGGWTVDDAEIPVVVNVIDDGYGNLTATVTYPEGFPEFVNEYNTKPTCVIISARKIAIGAMLPCGRFEFGVFDDDGNLVASAKNG